MSGLTAPLAASLNVPGWSSVTPQVQRSERPASDAEIKSYARQPGNTAEAP